LFTNTGPWVTCYTRGAAVLSTFPAVPSFQGGLEPVARIKSADGRIREAIDPDDFRGGFGVWSGTSFAAPILAGIAAAELAKRIPEGDDKASALTRALALTEMLRANPEQ
jgi:subtilisin family serine protease